MHIATIGQAPSAHCATARAGHARAGLFHQTGPMARRQVKGMQTLDPLAHSPAPAAGTAAVCMALALGIDAAEARTCGSSGGSADVGLNPSPATSDDMQNYGPMLTNFSHRADPAASPSVVALLRIVG
jgi:hypothetical protein